MNPEDIQRVKDLLPTSMGSEEIRATIAEQILRRSIFSARMESARYLARIRDVCAEISAGAINAAQARERLLNVLSQIGLDTSDTDVSLVNHASERRLNLIIDTQRQMAASVARIEAETDDTFDAFPAWELTRFGSPAFPRADWVQRWTAAGDSVGWDGALRSPWAGTGVGISFLALKGSPIWEALGAGAGGYRDTLGNPYPPFAYGSWMDWKDVDRETAERVGLIQPGARAEKPPSPSLDPDDAELLEAARRVGWPGAFDDIR